MVVNGFASVIIVDHDIYDWGLFQRWYNSIILCKQTFKLQDSFFGQGTSLCSYFASFIAEETSLLKTSINFHILGWWLETTLNA